MSEFILFVRATLKKKYLKHQTCCECWASWAISTPTTTNSHQNKFPKI